MNPPEQEPTFAPRKRFDPMVVGTICGILSAIGYTAANIFLRAVTDCDPFWVSCVKAAPTVLIFGPVLLARGVRGAAIAPSARLLLLIVLAGVFGQLAGNVGFQWALGVVGMALNVALVLGVMIVTGVVLGHWLLKEPAAPRMVAASIILLAAICILCLGANEANRSIPGASSHPLVIAAGIASGCLAGAAYSVLGVAIRYAARAGTPLSTILFTVGLIGTTALGGIAWVRIGEAMWATGGRDLAMMAGAGFCNAGAFWALTKALHLTNVVFVNALNASQVALAALAGVALFNEAVTAALVAGVTLTMSGLLIMRRR